MSREWEGMPKNNRFDDFYSVCEKCGRVGYDPLRPQWKDDEQCYVCLPTRERVMWQEIEWILYEAMVKLGRLPDPYAMTPQDLASAERRKLRARENADRIREHLAPLISKAKRA
jgi:hypothetical protein